MVYFSSLFWVDELYTVTCSPTDTTLVATGGGDDKGFLWRINQGDWASEIQGTYYYDSYVIQWLYSKSLPSLSVEVAKSVLLKLNLLSFVLKMVKAHIYCIVFRHHLFRN